MASWGSLLALPLRLGDAPGTGGRILRLAGAAIIAFVLGCWVIRTWLPEGQAACMITRFVRLQ
jgi:hypothetical protein